MSFNSYYLLRVRTCNDHYISVNHSEARDLHFAVESSPDTLRIDRRRAAIVGAARHLFIYQGYDRKTLADIVSRAGGSLTTLYKLFGNKDGLLEAVVRENVASGESLIREAEAAKLSPADTLRRIAEGIYGQFLDPEVIALVRIVIARSISEPEFSGCFLNAPPTGRATPSRRCLNGGRPTGC